MGGTYPPMPPLSSSHLIRIGLQLSELPQKLGPRPSLSSFIEHPSDRKKDEQLHTRDLDLTPQSLTY